MIEDTLTIEPPRAGIMARAAARQHRKTAVRLTSTTDCQSTLDSSTVGRRSAMPALLTSTSSLP